MYVGERNARRWENGVVRGGGGGGEGGAGKKGFAKKETGGGGCRNPPPFLPLPRPAPHAPQPPPPTPPFLIRTMSFSLKLATAEPGPVCPGAPVGPFRF